MTRHFLTILVMVFFCNLNGQTFEGSITYKMEALNPEPTMIPDSSWQKGVKEQFGKRGYMLQIYYYKKANYMVEIDAGKEKGFQIYDPGNGLLYSWQQHSDTAITQDTKMQTDKLIGIYDSDKMDTIMGIPCKSIVVKSETGETTLWYNPDYFKVNSNDYKKHRYGHLNSILKKIGCLPLKIERKAFMSHMVQTLVDFKVRAMDDKRFEVPKFAQTIEGSMH